MKKFFSVTGILVLLLSAIMILLSYAKTGRGGNNLNNSFLANLEDYNWKQENPYFNEYQTVNLTNKSIINSGNLSYKNQSYLNYPISSNISTGFNTGFKNSDAIKKQAVTGVPMNSAFLPNGNYLKDFGEDENFEMYREINSILDWNPSVDYDAKYNQGDYPLITTKKVANKWVASQDPQVQSEIMGLGVGHTAAMNSVVGSNRIFDYNFNNWQYTDRFVAWAGSSIEGIIVPPPADEINAAHINGTKIYGIVFLNGYYGLTKAMLRDFLKQDKDGTFAIVKVLINMAKYMNFDGWFYNNEPNGFKQEGFIMDSKISAKIIKQFNSCIQISNNPEIKKLQIMAYKNQGRLTIGGNNKPLDEIANELAIASDGLFTTDFGVKPSSNEKWSSKHSDFNSFDLHNMYNLGISPNEKKIGKRDLRDLTQKTLGNNTYDGININSLAIYAGTTSFDLAKIYLENLKHTPTISDDIYATVYANYYDDMIYTGQHRYLTNDDKGSLNPNSENQDLSYGVGDLVQENTILFDNEAGIDNVANFKTNFSTGQGQMFVSDDGSVVKNYPWNNRRLFDTQPTYKWNIENNQDKTPIKDITGFYDYYDSYRKGNSIVLGSGFDKTGKILPFVLNDKINWNIMGTNYNSANKNISFTYKISDKNDKWTNVKDAFHVNILVTFDDGSTKEITGASSEPDANGWVTVSSNLAIARGGYSNSKIAKLGLTIAPDSDNKYAQEAIKFNVGEMTVNFKKQAPIAKQSYISSLTSESAITRNNRTSLRLNWNVNSNLSDSIAYYEIYLQKTSGDTLFVGQTVNKNYYLRNLLITNNDKIIIKTVNRYNTSNSSFQAWNIKV